MTDNSRQSSNIRRVNAQFKQVMSIQISPTNEAMLTDEIDFDQNYIFTPRLNELDVIQEQPSPSKEKETPSIEKKSFKTKLKYYYQSDINNDVFNNQSYFMICYKPYLKKKYMSAIKQLRLKTIFKKINDFKNNSILILNDLCNFNNTDKRKPCLKNLAEYKNQKLQNNYKQSYESKRSRFWKCINKLPVIKEQDFDEKYYLWNIIMIITIIINLIFIPCDIILPQFSQQVKQNEQQWIYFLNYSIAIYGIDIFIKLNTGFYKNQQFISDRKIILINYVRNRLLWDKITLTTLMKFQGEYFSNYNPVKFLNFFILLKAFDLMHSIQKIGNIWINNKKIFNLFNLIQLLVQTFVLIHIVAIFFLLVTFLEQKYQYEETTWLEVYNLQGHRWTHIYMYAVYYSVTTMTTIGYGDITPKTTTEIIFCTFVMMIAPFSFAYTTNSIGQIISEYNKEKNEQKRQISLASRYLDRKKLSFELKEEVLRYLSNNFKEQQTLSVEQERLIEQNLNESLQSKIQIEEKLYIINNSKKFFGQFSQQFRNEVAIELIKMKLEQNEILYHAQQTLKDYDIYFIQSGSVDLFFENSKERTILKTHQQGDFFGEYSFITNQCYQTSAAIKYDTIIYSLSRSKFIDIIKKYQYDFQWFCFIKDTILFNEKRYFMYHECYSCNSTKHQIKDCPYIHYIPDKETTILKHIYSQPTKDRFKSHLERDLFISYNLSDLSQIQGEAQELCRTLYKQEKNSQFDSSDSKPISQISSEDENSQNHDKIKKKQNITKVFEKKDQLYNSQRMNRSQRVNKQNILVDQSLFSNKVNNNNSNNNDLQIQVSTPQQNLNKIIKNLNKMILPDHNIDSIDQIMNYQFYFPLENFNKLFGKNQVKMKIKQFDSSFGVYTFYNRQTYKRMVKKKQLKNQQRKLNAQKLEPVIEKKQKEITTSSPRINSKMLIRNNSQRNNRKISGKKNTTMQGRNNSKMQDPNEIFRQMKFLNFQNNSESQKLPESIRRKKNRQNINMQDDNLVQNFDIDPFEQIIEMIKIQDINIQNN